MEMDAATGGRVLGVEYREVTPGSVSRGVPQMQSLGLQNVEYKVNGLPTTKDQMQVVPGQGALAPIAGLRNPLAVRQPVNEHYPTSDGYSSPYETLRCHLNRNPFFRSFYDLPADLRSAPNPPSDYVVLESQPELRYMLTGPPAQEPAWNPEYGKCLDFQKFRIKVTQSRIGAGYPIYNVHISEVMAFGEDGQVIDTGLAVAFCNTFGNSEDGEEPQRVLDGNPYTKFLRKDGELPLDLDIDLGIRCKVCSYAWRTADDNPDYDPVSWNFQVFTKHGWATVDQVTKHYVPTTRHCLVGPFELCSPYDPSVHVYREPLPSPCCPTGHEGAHMGGVHAGGAAGLHSTHLAEHAHASSHVAPEALHHLDAELNELVLSTFPQQHGWERYHAEVETLLAANANPNYLDARGRTALLKACAEGDGYVIHRLVQCGANMDAQAYTGEAPLHRLCLTGDHRNLRLLLDLGANPNVQDRQGDTPLNLATAKMDLGAVNLLLEYYALKTLPNCKGQIPIDIWEEEMRIGHARGSQYAGQIRTALLGAVRTPIEA